MPSRVMAALEPNKTQLNEIGRLLTENKKLENGRV